MDRGGGLRSFDRFRCPESEESVCSAAHKECETELKPQPWRQGRSTILAEQMPSAFMVVVRARVSICVLMLET